jgi:hypothetical protein
LGQVEGDRLVFVRYEAEGGENRGGVVIAFCCGLQLPEYLAHSTAGADRLNPKNAMRSLIHPTHTYQQRKGRH